VDMALPLELAPQTSPQSETRTAVSEVARA
jgi:hypothetical protein